MSVTTLPPKTSLWREAFRAFRRQWPVWQKLALVLCLIQIPSNYVTLMASGYLANPDFYSTIFQIEKNGTEKAKAKEHDQEDAKTIRERDRALNKKFEALTNSGGVDTMYRFLAVAVTGVLGLVQIYLFCGFFMKHEGVVPGLRQSVGGFFGFVGICILWWLMIIGLMILAGIVFGLSAIIVAIVMGISSKLLHMSTQDVEIVSTVLGVLGVGAIIAFYVHIGMRYAMVFPLASVRENTPLKNSSVLTRGNIMRLFGNYIMLFLILIPLAIGSFSLLVDFGVYKSNIPVTILIAFVYAALNTGVVGLLSAFRATACRLFIEEKRNVDPSFTLAFKPPSQPA